MDDCEGGNLLQRPVTKDLSLLTIRHAAYGQNVLGTDADLRVGPVAKRRTLWLGW